MPGNRATAYGEDINYSIYHIDEVAEDSLAMKGTRLVFADDLADEVAKACGIVSMSREGEVPASAFADTVLMHPLNGKGYDHDVPMLPADYVTTEQEQVLFISPRVMVRKITFSGLPTVYLYLRRSPQKAV